MQIVLTVEMPSTNDAIEMPSTNNGKHSNDTTEMPCTNSDNRFDNHHSQQYPSVTDMVDILNSHECNYTCSTWYNTDPYNTSFDMFYKNDNNNMRNIAWYNWFNFHRNSYILKYIAHKKNVQPKYDNMKGLNR